MKIMEYENFVFYSPDGKVYFAAGTPLNPDVYQINDHLKENEMLLYISYPVRQWFFIIRDDERKLIFHGEGNSDMLDFIKRSRSMMDRVRPHLTEEDKTIRIEPKGAVLHCTSDFRIIYMPLFEQKIPTEITYGTGW